MTAETPAWKVPSGAECHFCDISRNDCPNRIDGPAQSAEETTADF